MATDNGNSNDFERVIQAITELRNETSGLRNDMTEGLRNVRQELKQDINNVRQELKQDIDASVETMRNIETSLLTEFHKYARSHYTRLHTMETTDHDMMRRLAMLEERVMELEGRIRPKQ